jgi:hypothetical protein
MEAKGHDDLNFSLAPTSRGCILKGITSSRVAMHFLKALIISLLPLAVLGAKKPAPDKFQTYHSKALSSAPLKLDDSIYGKLTTAPRDYSAAVLLTALESRFGCALCQDFQPEWDLLSKSWTRGDKKGESRLIFGTLDFSDGKSTFQSVGSSAIFLTFFAYQSHSLAFKLHQYFCSFHQRLDRMLYQRLDP